MDNYFYNHSKGAKILLEEYRISSSRIDNFNKLLWNLGIVFFSLCGYGGYLVSRWPIEKLLDFYQFLAITGLIIFGIEWWVRIAGRWNSYLKNLFYRVKEIEKLLGMYSNRAIDDFDKYIKKEGNDYRYIKKLKQEILKNEKMKKRQYVTVSICELRSKLNFCFKIFFSIIIFVKFFIVCNSEEIKAGILNTKIVKCLHNNLPCISNDVYFFYILVISTVLLAIIIFFFYAKIFIEAIVFTIFIKIKVIQIIIKN